MLLGRFFSGLILGILLSAVIAKADSGRAAFSLELDPSGISAQEKPALEEFLGSVSSLLPEGLKKSIDRPIRVRFSRMSGQQQLEVPACAGSSAPEARSLKKAKKELLGHDNIGGHASVVDLNALFKQDILAGPSGSRSFECGHRTMYRLAQATLIHELAHVLDAGLGDGRSTKDHFFQKLMGFTKQWDWHAFLFRALEPKNHLLFRSPDPYELKNIKETFAVNFEYFVLDPEFGCRRPTVDHFFRKLLGVTTPPSCTPDTTIYENSDNSAVNLKLPLNLDPSRIYDVHYVLASKGDAMMSRWGHAMFRLIVCAPERKQVGPECLQDVQYHVILSYRANVQDLVLSYTKGLFGDYPSQLFVLPLPEVLNEYNKLELRDLISLPLKLTPEEKEQFVYRTLEQYWEYQGRYYFFTNNCATEAVHFLQGIVPDEKIQKLRDMTPLGLESDLTQTRLIDPALIHDRNEAISKGYFFASKRPVLDSAFREIQDRIANLPVHSTDEYMRKTSAEERLSYFEAVMKSTEGQEHLKMAAYFYLLESSISSQDEQRISAHVSKRIEEMGDRKRHGEPTEDHGINDQLIQVLQANQPWSRLSSGYGIPQAGDFDNSQVETQTEQKKEAMDQLQAWIKQEFQEDLAEFQHIEENKIAFRHEIALPQPRPVPEKP